MMLMVILAPWSFEFDFQQNIRLSENGPKGLITSKLAQALGGKFSAGRSVRMYYFRDLMRVGKSNVGWHQSFTGTSGRGSRRAIRAGLFD